MTARESKVPPHRFDEDLDLSRDLTGRRWCRCGLPGGPGDDRHPVDAPALPDVLHPPVPLPAREYDSRRLGEREDAA